MSKSKIEQVSLSDLEHWITISDTIYEVLQFIGYKQLKDRRVIDNFKRYCEIHQLDYSSLKEDEYIYQRCNYPTELKCTVCGQMKTIDHYYISNNRISHTCKECTCKKQREKYHQKQQQLNQYKAMQGCQKCGIHNFYLIEFHHTNPMEKDYGIADNPNAKFETIQKELDKCIPLCCNCHREFHYLERIYNITIEDYLNDNYELSNESWRNGIATDC